MTPRQLQALLAVAEERTRHEQAETLSLHVLAARGKPEAVRAKLKELAK